MFSLVRVYGRIAATFSQFSKLFMGNNTWYVSVMDDNMHVVNKNIVTYSFVLDETQRDQSIISALESIEKGSDPRKHAAYNKKCSEFGFIHTMKSPCGKFIWDVVARDSADGRPTIELMAQFFPKEIIKIRFGSPKDGEY